MLVSDFYTPRFFDPVHSSAIRYSFTDAIKRPRQVLRGGYLSWHDPKTDHWWQQTWFGSRKEYRDLGVFDVASTAACGPSSMPTPSTPGSTRAWPRATARSRRL